MEKTFIFNSGLGDKNKEKKLKWEQKQIHKILTRNRKTTNKF